VAYWICQIAGWLAYALINAAVIPVPGALPWTLAGSAIGLALTHGLRAVAKRQRWAGLPLWKLGLRAVLASVLLSAISIGLGSLIRGEKPAAAHLVFFANLSAVYLGWQLIYFGAQWLMRARRAELYELQSRAAAQAAELRALKAQLDPHFLFNALNGIRAMIAIDPPRAQDLITQLAALLRHALSGADTVPLSRELEVVKSYLAIEGARLEDRLRVRLDVPDDCLGAQVPALLVQSLVENGIKHGVARLPAGGEIALSARLHGGELHLEVANSAAVNGRSDGTGLGLQNARDRLRLLFGETARLDLDRSSAERTVARVSIPCPSKPS
jgi:LytS/YehU family sensor histidine kinase